MGDYEHTATVSADPDALFRYLADVHNLPDYFAAMQEAEPTGEHADGGEEGEAWFSVDAGARTLAWGSEGPNSYRGELQVSPADSGAQVAVRLHTERADGPGIRAGLEQTLATIKQQVEGSSTDRA